MSYFRDGEREEQNFKREIKGARGGCKGKAMNRMQLIYDENEFVRNW